jgi:acyl dehydratase
MKLPARLVNVGERCSKNLTLSEENIKSFATRVEDFNPLHHDAEYAAQSRFGGLIASGTQPVAYFMAMLASHFCDERQPLGLEFSMKLRKAAHLGDTLTMSWEVTESHWKESLNGDMVTLTGQIVNQRGETVTVGCAKILVMPKSSTAATDTDRAAHA